MITLTPLLRRDYRTEPARIVVTHAPKDVLRVEHPVQPQLGTRNVLL